jgi:uncharacterized protein
VKVAGVRRPLYLAAGWLSFGAGTIGIFLPLLPTVPFYILAAFCFAHSSPALEAKLMNHPRYGPHLVAWRQKGIVSRKGKIAASMAFAGSIALGFAFMALPFSLIPPLTAAICLTWLWRRPES